MWTCPDCSTEIADGLNICGNCGGRRNGSTTTDTEREVQRAGITVDTRYGLFFCVTGGILGSIVFLLYRPSSPVVIQQVIEHVKVASQANAGVTQIVSGLTTPPYCYLISGLLLFGFIGWIIDRIIGNGTSMLCRISHYISCSDMDHPLAREILVKTASRWGWQERSGDSLSTANQNATEAPPIISSNGSKQLDIVSWFAYLFILLFFLVGLGCLVYAPVKAVKTAMFIARAQTAVGTVVSYQMDSNRARSSNGRTSMSTTYAPEVTFTAPDGRTVEFRSQLSSSSMHYGIGQTVPVYFDPAHPSQAEIKSFIPLWMPIIFVSGLGLAFCALSGGALFTIHRDMREKRLKKEAEQRGLAGWRAYPTWQSNAIRAENPQDIFFLIFAAFWGSIALPIGVISIVNVFASRNWKAVIGLLFPVVGVWLLTVAVRKTLQKRRFGELILRMDPFPCALGGAVGGYVEMPSPFSSGTPVEVTVSCLRVTTRRNVNHFEQLWRKTVEAIAMPASTGARVTFSVPVPGSLPPSRETAVERHEWRVQLKARLSGLDLDSSFVVPVAAEQPPPVSPAITPAAAEREAQTTTTEDSTTCPKCGHLQPPADTCRSCQIIFAKYRHYRETAVGGVASSASRPARIGFVGAAMIVVALLLAGAVGGGWYLWEGRATAAKGDVRAKSSGYRNEKYRFSMAVPDDWKILTVKEAIQCATLRDVYGDQYLLLASPTTPDNCLLVVNIAGVSLQSFTETGWDGFAAEIGSRHPVKFSEVKNVDGFTLHRIGYEVAGYYREDAYFATGDTLIELYFYLPLGRDATERTAELRSMINENLRRLPAT